MADQNDNRPDNRREGQNEENNRNVRARLEEQQQNFDSPPRAQIIRGNPDAPAPLPNRNKAAQERQEQIEVMRFGIVAIPFLPLEEQAQNVAQQRILPRRLHPIQPRAGNVSNAGVVTPDRKSRPDNLRRDPDSPSRGR
jgi:hypothetical protein